MLGLLPKSGIIVASVIGAASVLVGVLYLQPQIFASSREPYSVVVFEGLEDTYLADEPVEFYIKIEGYGCDSGFPTVWIEKISGNQTGPVWERMGELRLFPAGYSCPHEELDQVRHIGDMQAYNTIEQERLRTQGPMPIVLDEGKYLVHMDGGTAPHNYTPKWFTVIKGSWRAP